MADKGINFILSQRSAAYYSFLSPLGIPLVDTSVNDEGALLVMPPFKRGNFLFNTKENEDGYAIAKLRVHIERAIE